MEVDLEVDTEVMVAMATATATATALISVRVKHQQLFTLQSQVISDLILSQTKKVNPMIL